MNIKIREPGSTITHFIAWYMSSVASLPLILKSDDTKTSLAFIIYVTTMILLYAVSTIYHSIDINDKVLHILKKIDHMMVFVHIAGCYTPICLIVLDGALGYFLLSLICVVTIIGILVKAFYINSSKWFTAILYILSGWLCLPMIDKLWNTLPHAAFGWLFACGVIYTIGAIVYALKFSFFNSCHKYFDSHAIFHLFIMGGSSCYFVFVYCYVA